LKKFVKSATNWLPGSITMYTGSALKSAVARPHLVVESFGDQNGSQWRQTR